ncbi:LOW QUALITY PROTEIN: volume-regulated anion channel subunit LRRC8D [Periophthalmus magnuspinnatus]|uniref:LOW QUALITY PROTEIN: volume-regulated anion channel subunit LRRC8D n=1 Tax=Periophthalmus magnuspinnatus TaxID=409849 RepID=UPI00145BFC94|nr:LOW QUALITY PROTEIN: volume-regulated anion channel subunit LRRC8D [Periophthalmus magnuspinnatus]
MFSLSELAPLNQHQNQCKLLKPWWEVFMDYLGVLMLLASVLACTEQLSRDKLLCIPLDPHAGQSSSPSDNMEEQITSQPSTSTTPTINSQPQGRRTNLVYQQYVYISQVCYHDALPFCSRFFPYMALMQSLVLVTSGSFWLHFPHTSARIEHFLTILSKCCESPWTSQALFHAAQQDTAQETNVTYQRAPLRSSSYFLSMNFIRNASIDSSSDSPLLKRAASISTTVPPSPCLSSQSCTFEKTSTLLSSQTHPFKTTVFENHDPQRDVSLDKNDGEQARALFEKVRKFRSHNENSTVIYQVYLAQTVFKLFLVVLIGCYTIPLLSSFSFSLNCEAEEQGLVGYSSFQCIHVLSSLLRNLLLAYMSLLGVYGLLNLYTLGWILHSALRQFSFPSVKDASSLKEFPDLRNDLAFLLHMLDQYDPLLVQRLSVFLSPLSEHPLGEDSLERSWGEEQLRAQVTVDTEGSSRLTLVALPRIPSAVYTLSHLHVLRLELITDARFTAQLSNMSSLRELHLYHCSAAIAPGALSVLQDRLEVLHLTFSHPSQLPRWVHCLRGLQQLHLSGHLYSEGVARSWALGSLRQLHHLRVLVIYSMLQRIPGELCEVASTLVRLEIHNEGTRLLAQSGLKRLFGLTEVLLQDCQLERLPSALTALTNLCSLDLQHNRLRTLEEIGGLSQLRHLSNLRLAYNQIVALPPCISVLQKLKLLDLANNQLHSVPLALFTLRGLQKLLLSGNLLQHLPGEVRALQSLTELDVSGNRLESLPSELFSGCLKLRVLNASHNYLRSLPRGVGALTEVHRLDLRSNSLEELPCELVHCSGLCGGGLLVEDWLYLSLPLLVRDLLSQSQSSSRPESDTFPYFSPTQWCFHSTLESQI